MLKFKLKRCFHKIFPKKTLEKVNLSIVKGSCKYWKCDIFARYTPFHSAQDVFEYLKEEEEKKTKPKYNYFCGGGCGGGCIGGCGGGCI